MNNGNITEIRPGVLTPQHQGDAPAQPSAEDRIAQIDAANDDAVIALDALRTLIDDNPDNKLTPTLELILPRLQATWNRIEELCMD